MIDKLISKQFALESILEKVEIHAWKDIFESVPKAALEKCGGGLLSAESACASAVRTVDILAFNRVIGLGVDKPINGAALDSIIREYSNLGIPRFFVQMQPEVLTDETGRILAAHGFSHYNNWVKLFRSTEPLSPVKSDLRVRAIEIDEAGKFADILLSGFDWPESLRPLIVAPVGRGNWHYYMAYDNDRPVATAALFISGQYGWIDMASTLADFRGRGAQSLLVERRIHDAAELGCKWLVVETAEEKPDKPAPSYRNMRRLGFETAYVRPNYIFKNDSRNKS